MNAVPQSAAEPAAGQAIPASSTEFAQEWVVRLYGDSLGLPRYQDGIHFSATYAELFCAWLRTEQGVKRVSLYNRSQGGATAPQLARLATEDNSYFGPAAPQLLILQCGICDCAPRPVPLGLRRLIGRLPGCLQRPVIRLLHRYRPWLQRHGCVWRHTDAEPFRRAVTAWIRESAEFARAVFVVNIAPPTQAGEAHSPGLVAGVNEYNKLLQASVASVGSDRVVLVDVHATLLASVGTLERCVNQADGHHLSMSGHELYFAMLKQHFLALASQVSSRQ